MIEAGRVKLELRQAVIDLSDRGLYHSAKWCAELLNEIDEPTIPANPPQPLFATPVASSAGSSANRFTSGGGGGVGVGSVEQKSKSDRESKSRLPAASSDATTSTPKLPASLELRNVASGATATSASASVKRTVMDDCVILAKTYFDVREYERAAYVLRDRTSPIAVFLRGYSTYLAGERRKESDGLEKADSVERYSVVNPNLKELHIQLSQLFKDKLTSATHPLAASRSVVPPATTVPDPAPTDLSGDPHLLFLYGLVLRDMDLGALARAMLVASVNLFPWNWSAWKTLASLCEDQSLLSGLKLTDHWMKQFWLADLFLDLQQTEPSDTVLPIVELLQNSFPRSSHVKSMKAQTYYAARRFDESSVLFEELRAVDPYRLEGMDVYSNILYVKESKAELSLLAKDAMNIDKYRFQTCAITGNYYSLKLAHEKAVLYFKRALRLNPRYLSAWTLMGHEYVEMRNTAAAIECYRKAIDINPKDYRAWYGLGQTYEILQMHGYSLYYYKKATALRQFDPRMWCAMGEAYEHLNQTEFAVMCYQRAENNGDSIAASGARDGSGGGGGGGGGGGDGLALSKLAKLFENKRDFDKAALYYHKIVDRFQAERSASAAAADTMSDVKAPSSATTGGAVTAAFQYTAEMFDALLFLADYYKQKKNFERAERYCNDLLDAGGGGGGGGGGSGTVKDRATALLREIRSVTSSSAATANTAGNKLWTTPSILPTPTSSAAAGTTAAAAMLGAPQRPTAAAAGGGGGGAARRTQPSSQQQTPQQPTRPNPGLFS